LTPAGALDLVRHGHRVVVEAGAGTGSGYLDEAYALSGAEILPAAEDVWSKAELLVKVKEPQPQEFPWMRAGLTLFTYLHLATTPDAADALIRSGATSIAYETVMLGDGSLPLLIPMSEIAGRLAPEIAGQYLRKPGPGRGKLLSGMPGVPAANVVIFGAGRSRTPAGFARSRTSDRDCTRLEELRDNETMFPNRVTIAFDALDDRADRGRRADRGVLVKGGQLAPKLVRGRLRTVVAGG
jgi:alanine dehydrogenase